MFPLFENILELFRIFVFMIFFFLLHIIILFLFNIWSVFVGSWMCTDDVLKCVHGYMVLPRLELQAKGAFCPEEVIGRVVLKK